MNNVNAKQTAINTIYDWFCGLPQGTAILRETKLPYEHVMSIEPRNADSCSIEFRISNYGTFGLHFGKGFNFEDIKIEKARILEICEAVERGRVTEDVWEWRGKIIKTKGRLSLRKGALFDKVIFPCAGLLGTKRRIDYEAYHGEEQ